MTKRPAGDGIGWWPADDRQAAVRERHLRIGVAPDSRVVRAAVGNRDTHAHGDGFRAIVGEAFEADESSNTAHGQQALIAGSPRSG
jgi:hypothetical protein